MKKFIDMFVSTFKNTKLRLIGYLMIFPATYFCCRYLEIQGWNNCWQFLLSVVYITWIGTATILMSIESTYAKPFLTGYEEGFKRASELYHMTIKATYEEEEA